MAKSIVERGEITVPAEFGIVGREGAHYAIWYPLLSLIAVPFVACGQLAAKIAGLPSPYVVNVFAILLSTIIATMNIAATKWMAKKLGADEKQAILAALIYGFTTLAFTYSRTFYADPLLTLLITVGIGAAVEREPRWLGPACALAILAKPTGVLLGAMSVVWAAKRKEWRLATGALLGSAAGTGLYALYNWLRFETVWKAGQPNFWSAAGALEAVAGLLLSPGVGLFVYAPIAILALRQPRESHARFVLALAGGFLLLHACWGRWYASDWGPRFMMPVLPALIALAVMNSRRRLVLALAAVGFVGGLPTFVAAPERLRAELRETGLRQGDNTWTLDAPIFAMWGTAARQIAEATHTDVQQFASFHARANDLSGARNFRIIPLWWWMLPMMGLSRWLGAAVAGAMLCAGVWLIAGTISEGLDKPSSNRFPGKVLFSRGHA